MRDAIGNTIHDGDLVTVNVSLIQNAIFQVLKLQEPGNDLPSVLILGLTIPVPAKLEEIMEIKCLRNPDSEKLIEQVTMFPKRTM